MFAPRYFAPRYFAGRYFAPIGAGAPAPPASTRAFIVSNGVINGLQQNVATHAYVRLTGQVATVGPTTAWTATEAGIYRVSGTGLCTSAGATGTLGLGVTWGSYTSSFFTGLSLTSAGANAANQQLVYLDVSETVTYTATVTAGTGGLVYSLFLTVEKMWVI